MPNSSLLRVLALAAAFFSTTASALPATTVTWVQQHGIVSGNEPVEAWVRLTVDAAATEALVLDGTTTGFDPSDLADFGTIDRVQHQWGTACTGSFFGASCFDPAAPWAFSPSGTTLDNWLYAAPLILQPGQSKDFFLFSFKPQNGPVAPGQYRMGAGAHLDLSVVGTDKVTGGLLARAFSLGSTCASGAADCAFTRTVTAIPEPETYFLFLAGFAWLATELRRRRS